jgi:hypothetical protein
MRRRVALMAFALWSAPASAELLYRDFERLQAQDTAAAERLLAAVGDALSWANAVLEAEGKARLFCPAAQAPAGADAYRRALSEAIASTTAENAAVVDLPILLLKGLRDAHPCRDAGAPAQAPRYL